MSCDKTVCGKYYSCKPMCNNSDHILKDHANNDQGHSNRKKFILDIVYTYVNGSNAEHSKLKKHYFNKLRNDYILGSIASSLTKDNNEMCFSLRSIQTNMNWFEGNIYIITDHVPWWLNTELDNVFIVRTSDIMDRDTLPTFSSHAIEANIHKIRGLREHYLYFNDDYILGNQVTPDDFFDQEMCPVMYTDNRSTNRVNVSRVNFHRHAMRNANKLLNDYGIPDTKRYYLPHAPHPIVKSVITKMWNIFKESQILQSRRKFRDHKDIHTTYLYSMYSLEQPDKYCTTHKKMRNRCPSNGEFCIKQLVNNVTDTLSFFNYLKRRANSTRGLPKFMSINDHTKPTYKKYKIINKLFTNFLLSMYPNKSKYEKYDCNTQ